MTPAELRACLRRLGLSQMAAARVLGVDGRTVRMWLAGDREMTQPALRLLWLCERYPQVLEDLGGWRRVA